MVGTTIRASIIVMENLSSWCESGKCPPDKTQCLKCNETQIWIELNKKNTSRNEITENSLILQ